MTVFNLFKRRDDGELEFVKACDGLQDTRQSLESFRTLWPGEYVVRDTDSGKEVNLD
jgi:hypothetical protein